MFTPGNVDDPEPLYSESFIENVKGKLCGDKGYIGKQLFEFLSKRKKAAFRAAFAEREGFEPPEV